jgi:hypothetical protein
LLALAEIYDGASRSDSALIGGVTLQIVRDWVVRFNAWGPDGLLDGKAPGKSPLLNDTQRGALAEIVEGGPIPAIHGVVGYRFGQVGPGEAGADAIDVNTILSPIDGQSLCQSDQTVLGGNIGCTGRDRRQ